MTNLLERIPRRLVTPDDPMIYPVEIQQSYGCCGGLPQMRQSSPRIMAWLVPLVPIDMASLPKQLFAESIQARSIASIPAWIPAESPPVNESFYGVPRAIDSKLYGLHIKRFGGMSTEQMIQRVVGRQFSYGADNVLIVCSPSVAAELPSTVITDAGNVEVMPDGDCPDTTIWSLQLDTWEFAHTEDMTIGALVCTHPGLNARGTL